LGFYRFGFYVITSLKRSYPEKTNFQFDLRMAAKHITDPTETFVEDAGTPLKVAVEVFRKIGSVQKRFSV
jgi:hypothetical protein